MATHAQKLQRADGCTKLPFPRQGSYPARSVYGHVFEPRKSRVGKRVSSGINSFLFAKAESSIALKPFVTHHLEAPPEIRKSRGAPVEESISVAC